MLNDLPTVQRFRAPLAFTQLPATPHRASAPVPASKMIGFPNPSKSLASFQGVRGRFALTVPCRERFFSLVTSRDFEHPFVCAFTSQRADMALNNCPFVLSNANGSNAPHIGRSQERQKIPQPAVRSGTVKTRLVDNGLSALEPDWRTQSFVHGAGSG